MKYSFLKSDPEIFKIVKSEEKREAEGLELIPSENYVSKAVLQAMGSIFTNKYSEGFPGKRYYGGNQNTDQLELLAIERAKKLFRADHANVQPLSGAPANTACYLAWCNLGDTIMGMDLTHGGHLTHGKPETHQAKMFNFVRYYIKDIETGELDYDRLFEDAKKSKPKIILAGFTSFPRNLDYAKFKEIADAVGAITMADIAHTAGLIAGGVLDNPLDFGFNIVSTTTHKTLRGPRGGMILTKGNTNFNPLKPVEKTIDNIPALVDRSVFPGLQGGPHMHQIAGVAVALKEASTDEFKSYAKQVLLNSKALAQELMNLGAKLVTNGTDNHMMLVNTVSSFNLDGAEVENLLDRVGITLNKNVIPDDVNPPYKPSGIRLGTPSLTTRGFVETEMKVLANLIMETVASRKDENKLANIHSKVKELSLSRPIPSI